ncbi:MAG: hypothetical protein ACRDID_24115, partial [Ktedonobacterales bacterium]
MEFGVTEYAIVFRRALRKRTGQRSTRAVWTVARPFTRTGADIPELAAADAGAGADANTVAQVFVVPIYSTLSLDT